MKSAANSGRYVAKLTAVPDRVQQKSDDWYRSRSSFHAEQGLQWWSGLSDSAAEELKMNDI